MTKSKDRKTPPTEAPADETEVRPGQPREPWVDRRQTGDRRSGKDRREPGDRRSGRDRRTGIDRRTRDVGPPPGVSDRRSGQDRRVIERRSGRDRRDDTGWIDLSLEDITVEPLEGEDPLVDAARAARGFARARYSEFRVGAALETIDGHVITGCNVENASYGLTLCAERVALAKALSEGYDAFTRIAVVTEASRPTTPCGACRQMLWEYCGDIQVILAAPTRVLRRYQLGRLLPVPFDHASLD